MRAREYPRQSGIKDERERSSYHQERLRTRGHEALTPGEGQVVRGLRFIKFHDTGTRREKIGSFTKRVVHPETGEVAWTVPTRWHKKAYQMVPRAVTYTSALSPTEKQVLSVLYDSACPWTFHVKGKFKVQGLSQSYIASAVGRSQPQVSRILQSLEAKLFVKRSDEGREDASCPYTYHLASYENGAWTYPALHRRSGRARLQWYAGMSTTELNWHAAVTKAVRRRKPKRKGKRIDEAAEKLQRDQQRKRTSETGLRGTEEIFGPGIDCREEMQQAQREEAERRENIRRRSGRDGPPVEACG